MLVIQGLYQHSLDIVHVKGGFSAFRGEAKVSIDQAKRMSKASLTVAAFTYSVWWLIFYQFWVSRHAMCNYVKCPVNPFTLMKEKPK